VVPTSFRAGRWGISNTTAQILCSLGYRIDSSVTPFVNWQQYHGPDFSSFGADLFYFKLCDRSRADMLLEIPVTVGFLQSNFECCQRLMEFVKKPMSRKLRLAGILQWLNILNMVWLSPEQSTAAQMIKLAERMRQKHYSVINLAFHSNSLMSGLSPFVRTSAERDRFFARVRKFLTYARRAGFQSKTLAQFENSVRGTKPELKSVSSQILDRADACCMTGE
jgi:hypothetical protein